MPNTKLKFHLRHFSTISARQFRKIA